MAQAFRTFPVPPMIKFLAWIVLIGKLHNKFMFRKIPFLKILANFMDNTLIHSHLLFAIYHNLGNTCVITILVIHVTHFKIKNNLEISF